MSGQGIMGCHLDGDLMGKFLLQASGDVDCGQFCKFMFGRINQLLSLFGDVGGLAIGLRANGDIFASRHRHGTGHKSCHAG